MQVKIDSLGSCLGPSSIPNSEYAKILGEIKEKIQNKSQIANIFERYSDTPYYFSNKDMGEDDEGPLASINDAASLYVLLDYLLTKDKDRFNRDNSYKTFINGENEALIDVLYSIFKGKHVNQYGDIKVDFIKGSLYKIKKYFLENNKIKDIRGASAILDHLNTDATLKYLEDKYIRECAIYCGGGNVIIIAPEEQGEIICKDLERLYSDIALTAKNAFEYTTCTLGEIAAKYNEISRDLNEKLEDRKKVKLYVINPENEITNITIKGERHDLYKGKKAKSGQVCQLCGIRDAYYLTPTSEGEIEVCPSCLRKTTVGRDKAIFYDEFEKSQGVRMTQKHNINSLNDIADSRGYVALIYADGNNLGNVVKNIKTPFQHMYFSRKLESVTKSCVYSAIYDTMSASRRDILFEAICLGGDDLLIVVPADVSLNIANKLVERFDTAFNYNITISAGICIAKSNTPIRNMFSISQSCLKNAKIHQKKNNEKYGTLDVVVLEGNSNIDLDRRETTLFPMTNKRAEKIINVINKMKADKKSISKSQIYKLRYASNNMSVNEFQLFYLYQIAKLESRKYTEYICEIYDSESSSFAGLVRINDEMVSPWEDIALLWDYSGGEKNEPDYI